MAPTPRSRDRRLPTKELSNSLRPETITPVTAIGFWYWTRRNKGFMKTAALSLIYPGYLFELMGKYMTGNTHVYALAPKHSQEAYPKLLKIVRRGRAPLSAASQFPMKALPSPCHPERSRGTCSST